MGREERERKRYGEREERERKREERERERGEREKEEREKEGREKERDTNWEKILLLFSYRNLMSVFCVQTRKKEKRKKNNALPKTDARNLLLLVCLDSEKTRERGKERENHERMKERKKERNRDRETKGERNCAQRKFSYKGKSFFACKNNI